MNLDFLVADLRPVTPYTAIDPTLKSPCRDLWGCSPVHPPLKRAPIARPCPDGYDDCMELESPEEELPIPPGDIYRHHNKEMSKLYKSLTHNADDFFISCSWEGKENMECDDYMSEVVTDMGMCWTFNGDKENTLHSDKTGENNGVGFWINIEQYEQMQGFDNDNGIKVHLHPQDNIPQVSNQGFAVPTSSHCLAAITYTVTHSLGDPYGPCRNLTLKQYDSYSRVKCENECQSMYIQEHCDCKPHFLPLVTNDMRLCDLMDTFQCVDQVIKKGLPPNYCNCTNECDRNIYGVKLSNADITGEIPPAIADEVLSTKVVHGYNIKHRIDTEEFRQTISYMEDTVDVLTEFIDGAKVLMDKEASSLQKAVIAEENLQATGSDVLLSLQGQDGDELLYQLYIQPYVNEAVKHITLAVNSLSEFQDTVLTNIRHNSDGPRLEQTLNDIVMKMIQAEMSITKLKDWPDVSRTIMRLEDIVLPYSILPKDGCYHHLGTLDEYIRKSREWAETVNTDYDSWESFYKNNAAEKLDYSFVPITPLFFGSTGYVEKCTTALSYLKTCVTAYIDHLEKMKEMRRNIKAIELNSDDEIPLDRSLLQGLVNLRDGMSQTIEDYFANKTNKAEMLLLNSQESLVSKVTEEIEG